MTDMLHRMSERCRGLMASLLESKLRGCIQTLARALSSHLTIMMPFLTQVLNGYRQVLSIY